MSNIVLNTVTGEKIPLNLSKKQVELMLRDLNDTQKNAILIQMLDIRKVSELFEKGVKKYIKTQEIGEDGLWQSFKVSNAYRYTFDKDKFEATCTEEERVIFDKMEVIKLKYQKATVYQLIK